MQFYALNKYPRGDADTCAAKPHDAELGDAELCPACGGPVSSLRWLPPFRVDLELYGKQFGDFAFLSGGNDFLVSQKFREVYFSLGLSGLTGFDLVDVRRVKGRKRTKLVPPAYFRVCPTRGEPAMDQVASGCEWIKPPTCPVCRSGVIMRWRRIVVEEGTWTGEDAFRLRGLGGTVMVTQRFKDACEQNGITNAYFTPAEEAGHDFYPGLKDPSELDRFR